jgi:hypothetical protein
MKTTPAYLGAILKPLFNLSRTGIPLLIRPPGGNRTTHL